MDIAHRLSLSTIPQTATGAGFAISLTGLTNNPTYGTCAQRGSPLGAVASGTDVPAGLTYQWCTEANGAIAGAVADTFTPDAPLAPEDVIFCLVSAPGHGDQSSPHVVFRDVPPQVGTGLFDEIFDLGTGPQVVAAAGGFAGLNLSFAVTGGGVSIDPNTGDVSVPTDVTREGEVVVVTAANSGGSASAAFQITVEDVAIEGAMPFGALTPAGMGGVPVQGNSITAGDPGGHWEITGGRLVPTGAGAGALAGIYPLVFDTGATLDVMIEDDHASARPEELIAVYASLPLSARGLMVQDGDGRGLGRLWLPARAWQNDFVLEPANWLEHSDPRQSVRTVTLAALTTEEGTENLIIQGFETQMTAGGLLPLEMQNLNGDAMESVRQNALIEIRLPCRHVTVRQNNVWSRTTADIVANDDYRDHWNTSLQLQGIKTQTSSSGARGEHIVVEDNYIHDLEKGVIITASDSYQGVYSSWSRNIIMDTYTGFGTIGYCDGCNVFDNRGLGVFAADEVTDGEVGSSNDGPHSGLFGFNADDPRTTANVNFIGNIFGSSAKVRNDLEIAAGHSPLPTYGATGVKLNDPRAPDSYVNIKIGFNLLVTRGLALELSGVSADPGQYVEVFHNTIAGNPDPQGGSAPVIYFTGSSNVRMWKNVVAGYTLGAQDGSGFYPRTLDTLDGYGNLKINFGTDDLGENDYFVGTDGFGALAGIGVDDYASAYIPKGDTGASLSPIKAGALGTGLYTGDGIHGAVYDKPAPVGGVTDVAPLTIWNGAVHFERSSQLVGSAAAPWQSVLMAWEGEIDAAHDDTTMDLFSFPSNRLYLRKFGGGAIQLYMKHSTGEAFMRTLPNFTLKPEDGLIRLVVSYDMWSGRIQFVKNGVLDNFLNVRDLTRVESIQLGSSPFRLHASLTEANRFIGRFGRAYLDPRETFFDLEDSANLSGFYAADGSFRDWGSNGQLVTGTPPLVYVRGTATGLANLGSGGAFGLSGGSLSQ